ncbi:NAD-dependent epimerase/dehydratase family protein [Croceitalea marina]|uniref:NAD-dependent epimerase/dehydratase family protein n=1 Tax=Croceitalea marina TaxID=1775166 RepID=A0ABW5MTQ0_9FLAO
MILVTGGTGLVGSHLLFHLASKRIRIRAIYRNGDRIALTRKVFEYYTDTPDKTFNEIDWVKADINDIPSLSIAFKGITRVYHCAALISFDPKKRKQLFKVNAEGTANLVNLCIEHKVEKLCHVSSIATIGESLDKKPVAETKEFNASVANIYALSKHQAEMEVWRGSQEGINTIIVNPGVIIGPGFWDNGSGRLFKKISEGLKFYPPGGTGFVTVKDVVGAMVNLMDSEITNENYILVSENLTYKEAFTKIAEAVEKKAPKLLLKKGLLAILWRLDWLKSNLIGSEQVLSKKLASSFDTTTIYSNEKIIKDSNFKFENLAAAINSCAATFLKENHSTAEY